MKRQAILTSVHLLVLTATFIMLVQGVTGQHWGRCSTDDECPGEAFCAIWPGCFMGVCVCSEVPSEAFGCLWKKAGDNCMKDETTNECTGPASECREGKCACPVNQSPTKHSLYWCDQELKVNRSCDNALLRRGETCQEGKVACSGNFREDPYSGVCRSGMPGEQCSKNEECKSNICNSSFCVCREGMAPYSQNMRYYYGNGYNVSSVSKCKPVNAPRSAVGVGGTCGGYFTCQGSTCMECPEGGVYVCVDLTNVGSITSDASWKFPPSVLWLLVSFAINTCYHTPRIL